MDFARGNDDYGSMCAESLTKALDGLSQDKNCLIVVDDLLYTTEWDTIIKAFHEIGKGSWTIVITTRQKDVAEHCCKIPECIHMLNILEANEAHELFVKTVLKRLIQFISFDMMLCISTTLLKLALEKRLFRLFCGKKNMKRVKRCTCCTCL
jgi:hypothetical protein